MLDAETLTEPLKVGLVEGVGEMLAEAHKVNITLPVLVTDMVGLTVTELHLENVPVEETLGEFVPVRVPV